jgi:predicted  nucleic acid-binding Zn-ribbon protein
MADQILKKLEEHDKKFEEHGKQLETIANTVVANQERLGGVETRLDRVEQNMATKEDTDEIMTTLDELVGLAKKKDEELTFMGERVDRVEKDVEKIKPLVGLETS